jgi:O-antigen/teichoic acid export membrane protein
MTRTPSAGRTVARNTVFLFAAQITLRLLGFVPVILLANYLGVEGYGLYNFAIAFATLFLPLCDLGIETLIVREIATHPESREEKGRNALGMKLVLAVATFGLIAAVALVEGSHREHLEILLLAGAVTILRAVPTTLSTLFRAAQRMELEAILVVTQRVFEILAALITVLAGLELTTLMILLCGAGLLSTAFAAVLARRNGFPIRPAFSPAAAVSLIRGGLPFALTGLATTLYMQIGTVIIGYFMSEQAVGIYRSAYNLVFGLSGFAGAISVALFPAVAQQYKENRAEAVRLTSRSISISLLLGLPVATGCMAVAGPIVRLLYHAEFAQAATTLRILTWWIPIMSTTSILGFVLAATNRQNLLLAIAVVNAITNLALNFLLIPLIGYNGAAIASVATETVGLLLLSTVVYKGFGSIYDLPGIIRILAASLLMLPLWFLSNTFGAIPLIITGAAVYAGALLALGAITPEDIRRGLRFVLRRPSGEATGR